MALRLTWTNRNVVANSVNIYRDDTALDPANLPAPLATITNGDAFYVDQTAENGKTYYYILGTKTANDLILTPNQPILVADNRGAGPANLLLGDDNLGYYGSVLSADFFNSAAILAAAKTTSGLPSALTAPNWHKFTRNGKILYVPDATFGQCTWNALYTAGLVYGIDATAPDTAPVPPVTAVNQLVKLALNGEDYKVRLMRGYSDGTFAGILATDFSGGLDMDSLANSQNNEYSDLIYSLSTFVPEKQRSVNFLDLNPEIWLGAAGSEYTSTGNVAAKVAASRMAMQERCTNGQAVNRGVRSYIYSSGAITATTRGHMTNIFPQNTNNNMAWLPVIELIEPTAALSA